MPTHTSSVSSCANVGHSAEMKPVSPPSPIEELAVNEYVRLMGLKAVELNGAIGTVISYDETRGRYGIRLHNGGEKALKSENLMRYKVDPEDICLQCRDCINLQAFLSCSCDPTRKTDIYSGTTSRTQTPTPFSSESLADRR